MGKTMRVLATVVLIVGMFTVAAASPSSAASCSISGAATASWGCARNTSPQTNGGWVKVQDLKSDGYCISVWARNSGGIWAKMKDSRTGQYIKHCSGSVGTYHVDAGFAVSKMRIFRGPGPWGFYRTFASGGVA